MDALHSITLGLREELRWMADERWKSYIVPEVTNYAGGHSLLVFEYYKGTPAHKSECEIQVVALPNHVSLALYFHYGRPEAQRQLFIGSISYDYSDPSFVDSLAEKFMDYVLRIEHRNRPSRPQPLETTYNSWIGQ